MSSVPFSQVSPTPGMPDHARAARRIDPFWDGLWSTGTHAAWSSRQLSEGRSAAEDTDVFAHWRMDPEQAWDIIDGDNSRKAIVSALGAIMGWRTLTSQQVAAFVDYPSLAKGSKILPAAFNSRLLDVGVFQSPVMRQSAKSPSMVVRLSRNRVLETKFLPGCTLAERVAITGGRDITAGGQYDRHNLLMAELALRAAEMCDLGAVLPETLSTVDLLAGTGLGRGQVLNDNGHPDRRSADATFVRPDGLRIAVELTASSSPAFKQKVHRWAKTLAKSTLENTGLVVLFVAAPPTDRAQGRQVIAELRKQVSAILREYPGLPGRRPGDRIYVAEWTDWFPARHTVDESFFSLRAELAPDTEGGAWRTVELLNPFDLPFEPANPEAMAAVMRGAAALGSSPSWLRGDPWPLWTLPVEEHGALDLLRAATAPSHGIARAKGLTPPAALTSTPFVSTSVAARKAAGAWSA